jgi:hypothetical protein
MGILRFFEIFTIKRFLGFFGKRGSSMDRETLLEKPHPISRMFWEFKKISILGTDHKIKVLIFDYHFSRSTRNGFF